MLTQLLTVKTRLGISEFDVKYDTLLLNTLNALGQRFGRECNRVLARTVDLAQEFAAETVEIALRCFPVETITRFELKVTEAGGWQTQAGVEYLLREGCFVSLLDSLGTPQELARVIYTGGFVVPGSTVGAGQTPLPDAL